MQDDHMEIEGTNLVPTAYGFYNIVTEERFDFDGNLISEDINDDTSD